MTEKTTPYLDRIRDEFVKIATEKGLEEVAAKELSNFLIVKMNSSWKNGMRFAQGRSPGQPAASAA